MNKLSSLFFLFAVSFNSLDAMKSILKKPSGNIEESKKVKKVSFSDPLAKYWDDELLGEVIIEPSCGDSSKTFKEAKSFWYKVFPRRKIGESCLCFLMLLEKFFQRNSL